MGTGEPGLGRSARDFRPEIQALRAVAVLSVTVYHLWPASLPGGFVGVDVFFVISGYLITAHLLRELRERGTISLPAFWARRARRLLPASLLVLAVTGIAVFLWIPRAMWDQVLRSIAAAALYIENWSLAADSVDYLARDNVTSPVQHFWSLSAEEQFYVAWPLLIFAAMASAQLVRGPRHPWIVGWLGAVTLASFAWCVAQTASEPSIAYFSTLTRAWEFGAGGLLAAIALVAPKHPAATVALSLTGWAAISASFVVITSQTAFPGVAAMLPVLGAVAVIAAGSDSQPRWYAAIVSTKPLQVIGDISYSVYLWHWPLIIVLPFVLDRDLGLGARIAILGASLLLGWLSNRFVENPVRFGVLARRRSLLTFGATAAAMALVAAPAFFGAGSLTRVAEADTAEAVQIIDRKEPCFGAAAADPANQPCAEVSLSQMLLPSLEASSRDFDADSWHACAATNRAIECVRGVPGGTRIALVGDSHAHQYLPAIEALAAERNWEVHVFIRGGCSFGHSRELSDPTTGEGKCSRWSSEVDKMLAAQDPFELVFTSSWANINQRFVVPPGETVHSVTRAGYLESWQPLISRGTTIVAIRDNADPAGNAAECIQKHMTKPSKCSTSEKRALRKPDYQALAATEIPGAVVIDFSDLFCQDGRCPFALGNVLVYRDGDHVTRTFILTLAPYLGSRTDAEVAAARLELNPDEHGLDL